jgi:hypothetical protein
MDNPGGTEEKVPGEKIPVPVKVTGCGVLIELQKGDPAYRKVVIVGKPVIVTFVVAITGAHPPMAGDV